MGQTLSFEASPRHKHESLPVLSHAWGSKLHRMRSEPRTKSYNASCATRNRTSPGNATLRSSIVPCLKQ